METETLRSVIYDLSLPLPIDRLHVSWLDENQVTLDLLRLDQTDDLISGNKWFKLAKNIQFAVQSGHRQLLSFGGAFSNHVFSFAHACHKAGLKSVMVIRGEELSPTSNPMLEQIAGLGTRLLFVDRKQYRDKYEETMLDWYREQVGDFYLIPEGGSNALGVEGAEAIADCICVSGNNSHASGTDYHKVFMACGTGATFAGMVRGFQKYALKPELVGLSVFRPNSIEEDGWLTREVRGYIAEGAMAMTESAGEYSLVADPRLPGYGKLTAPLVEFCEEFLSETGVLLDPVYTAKLLYFLKLTYQSNSADSIMNSQVEDKNAPLRLLAVHTGGLHGWLGYLGGRLPAQLSGTIKQRLYS